MAEHGKELIFREVRPRLFLQLHVRFLQFFLAILEFRGERLRLLEQVLRPRVRFDCVQNNADALSQLIEKRLVRGAKTIER